MRSLIISYLSLSVSALRIRLGTNSNKYSKVGSEDLKWVVMQQTQSPNSRSLSS